MIVPHPGPSHSKLNAQATPLRLYTKEPTLVFNYKVPGDEPDGGCVVMLEDTTASSLLSTARWVVADINTA